MHEFGDDDPSVSAYQVGDEVGPGVAVKPMGAIAPDDNVLHIRTARRGPAGLRRRHHRLGRRAGLRARLPDGRARDGQEGHRRASRAAARARLRPPPVRPRRPGDRPRPSGPLGVRGEPEERGLRRCSPSGSYANMCSLWTPTRRGRSPRSRSRAAATRLGIPVLRPIVEHGRTDLGVRHRGTAPPRPVQVGVARSDGVVLYVRVGGNRCTPDGYVRSTYADDEIDLLAAYCGDLDRCFLLPESLVVGRSSLQLRLEPPLNGQRACINLASDYEFAGAVAQLEERSAGSRKVRGSSPLSSTPSADRRRSPKSAPISSATTSATTSSALPPATRSGSAATAASS